MTKVSVIVPVFNSADYLEKSLRSIMDQTLKDIEIICVNDGSTDKSPEILGSCAKADPRVRVIDQENGGAGKARNTGLDAASGEYLAFLDADDLYEPDYLEKAYAAASAGNADMTVVLSDEFDTISKKYSRVPWAVVEYAIPPYRPMNFRTFTFNVFEVFVGWAWDKLFRRDFILEKGLRFQEIRSSNDMYFTYMAEILALRIEVVNEVLVHHRKNDSGSVSNTRERSWDCFHTALCALKEGLIAHDRYRELEKDFINYALHFSLWHLDSIKGEKQEALFNALKTQWLAEFDIIGKPEAYFYNKSEYNKLKKIISSDCTGYFSTEAGTGR